MAWARDTFLPTRRSLLGRLKDPQDAESWQDFYDSYAKLIYSVALRAGLTESEAQEVLQETMITFARKISKFEYDPAKGKFRGWLRRLIRWRIADQFRKRPLAQRRGEPDSATGTSMTARIPDPHGYDLEAIWDQEWKEKIFEAALGRVKKMVSTRQYQIFDLYCVKQWPAEKVARVLGISSQQVFLAKHRILPLVSKEVERLADSPF